LSALAREARLRPPWGAESLWQTAQARCRIGCTSRAKSTALAEALGTSERSSVGTRRDGLMFPDNSLGSLAQTARQEKGKLVLT
jgi:hypothetical protein